MDVRGQSADQLAEQGRCGRPDAEPLHVVEDQAHRHRGRCVEEPDQVGQRIGRSAVRAERRADGRHERIGVLQPGFDAQPALQTRRLQLVGAVRLREHGRLAEAGAGHQQRHRNAPPLRQSGDQGGAVDLDRQSAWHGYVRAPSLCPPGPLRIRSGGRLGRPPHGSPTFPHPPRPTDLAQAPRPRRVQGSRGSGTLMHRGTPLTVSTTRATTQSGLVSPAFTGRRQLRTPATWSQVRASAGTAEQR